MKRILVICILLLCLCLSVALFASCDMTPEKDTEEEETTAPGEHEHIWDEGTVVKEGTCDPDTKEEIKGEILYTCSVCGATRTEETAGHVWNDGRVISQATCAQTGMKLYECTNCKAKRSESIPVDPDSHDTRNAAEHLVTPPTSTSNGEIEKICTICGKGVSWKFNF